MKNVSYEQLIEKLSAMPKANVDLPNFAIIKSRILKRINIPAEETVKASTWFGVRITVGAIGSLLIIISLAMGTAVAALDSVPGQAIYPLKKIVENIELKLATNEEEQAALQIKFADKRLEELSQILEQSKAGEASEVEVSKAVASLQKTTRAALSAANNAKSTQPKVAVLTKLVAQSAVLKSAAIQSEGEVKAEIEKALETVVISQKEAIENIEQAGLKVEALPIEINIEPVSNKPETDNQPTTEEPEESN